MRIIELMQSTFESESGDIALYLAMSKKAADEGHSDIASYLYDIAMDEARHAAEFAMLLGKVKDTRTNLKMMIEDEIKAVKEKAEGAKIAHELGNEEVFEFFDRALHDETRHKEVLSKIMEKY